MAKWTSRKLVMTVVFGVGVPVLFQMFQIPQTITLTAMALGGAYLGANAIVARKKQ